MALSPATFWNHWKKNFPEARNATLLLAMSGGIDSMALATLLKACNIPFQAAHVNYHLRGSDSDEDMQWVEKWCAEQNIVLHLHHAALQAETSAIQEKARLLRYKWMHELLSQQKLGYLLTAHHAQDVAETVLMNLLKGTGLKGLHGILPKNGLILRPLLPYTKEEIISFCESNGITYRSDASNEQSYYLRNFIRNKILAPVAYEVPHVVQNISHTALRLQAVERIYQKAITTQVKKLIEDRGTDKYLPLRKLAKIEGYEALLYEWLQGAGFSSKQMHDVYELMEAHSGKWVESETHRLIKDRNFLILTKRHSQHNDCYTINEGETAISFALGTLHIATLHHWEGILDEQRNVALLDADTIQYPLLLRLRRQGDYLYPLGMNKKKKVARMLTDIKMPVHEKEKVWVLAHEQKIAWVVGVRIDERFKVKATTKKVLRVTLQQP